MLRYLILFVFTQWAVACAGKPDICIEPPCDDDTEDPNTKPRDCDVVDFTLKRPAASQVWLTGTFTGWGDTPETGAIPMERGAEGVFQTRLRIRPVGQHAYKFIVDTHEWLSDPENPHAQDDGFGGQNSVLEVCSGEESDAAARQCGTPDFEWRDAVIYSVMIDRFAHASAAQLPSADLIDTCRHKPTAQFCGGTLAGLHERLEYIDKLGANVLWLSPPYQNRESPGSTINDEPTTAYHGYWPSPAAIDYSNPSHPNPLPAVDERFGDNTGLSDLVTSVHERGMRIMLDYVMNHVDRDSPLFAAHADWFVLDANQNVVLCSPEDLWDHPYWGTRCGFSNYLPPFDFDVADALDWSMSDARWWASTFHVDAYRLDAIKHVPMHWLTTLRQTLEAQQPVFLLGETFDYNNPDILKAYIDPDTKLHGQFDFPHRARLCEAVFQEDGSLLDFSRWLAGNELFYGPDAVMSTWIGNHDIPRAIHYATSEIADCQEGSHAANSWTKDFAQPQEPAAYERLMLAFAILLTNPGQPLIYYGDEIGQAGGGDPDNRRLMPWDDGELNQHQLALREKIQALTAIRHAYPVLRRGYRITHHATQDTWVYSLEGCPHLGADITVAINRADEAHDIELPAGTYNNLLDDTSVSAGGDSLPLAPRTVLVLTPDVDG